jgi:hypothetical protein
MNRQELEAAASKLAVAFTEETSDRELELLVELAEKDAKLTEAEELNAELQEANVVAEAKAASKTGQPVVKIGNNHYAITAPQFTFKKLNKPKPGTVKRFEKGLQGTDSELQVVTAAQILEDKKLAKELLDYGCGFLVKLEKEA